VKIREFYYKSEGVAKNHKTARKWFEKAVDVTNLNKHEKQWAEANFWLGKMMVRGEGGSKNLMKGLDLIHEAT